MVVSYLLLCFFFRRTWFPKSRTNLFNKKQSQQYWWSCVKWRNRHIWITKNKICTGKLQSHSTLAIRCFGASQQWENKFWYHRNCQSNISQATCYDVRWISEHMYRYAGCWMPDSFDWGIVSRLTEETRCWESNHWYWRCHLIESVLR